MIISYQSGTISALLAHTQKSLVRDVSFSIHAGESLALIGETGSGKTMIALSILRLLPRNVHQTESKIVFCGADLPVGAAMRTLVGTQIVYIPQNGSEFLNPSKKIKHHLYDSLRKAGIQGRELHGAALNRLSVAGFEAPAEIMERYPFQLSGGMAQRVTIALAACARPSLVIADEPTNGLDQAAKERFMALLNTLFPGAALLIITHDIAVAALCDRTLVLCGGRRMEQGPSNMVLHTPRSPYTRALIGALVENGMAETPPLRSGVCDCPFYCNCPQGKDGAPCQPVMRRQDDVEWWCCTP